MAFLNNKKIRRTEISFSDFFIRKIQFKQSIIKYLVKIKVI